MLASQLGNLQTILISKSTAFCPHFHRKRMPPGGGVRICGSLCKSHLESQSLFRWYGSVLPTSLVCIARYRPEASRLSDLMRSFDTCSREIVMRLFRFSREDWNAPKASRRASLFGSAAHSVSKEINSFLSTRMLFICLHCMYHKSVDKTKNITQANLIL